VYDLAVERFAEFARGQDLPLTLFAIGQDLDRHESADVLAKMSARGHEIGNHTLDHRYDLTRLTREEMQRQVLEGVRRIEAVTRVTPVGFRAPGYTVTDELLEVVKHSGARYDSSVFPSPVYYGTKAAVMVGQRLGGRRSRSIVGSARVLSAPTRPYRIGSSYHQRGEGLLELPIQVTRGLRLPYIGTTLALAGPRRARWLTRMVAGEPLVNLELHGIDALDARDGLEALVQHQPDVRISWPRKLEAFASAISTLRAAGYRFVRLRDAADVFGG
jgi:peptidoglycan/xylan/chitin deacetylase (PgdA/CDA1 family)